MGTLAPILAPSPPDRRQFLLPDSALPRGTHLCASSGSGKSILIGHMAALNLLRGMPQVVFDPAGPAADSLLLRLHANLSPPLRRLAWRCVTYLDMAGRVGPAPRFPFLFRLDGDTHSDVAERFLQTCLAIDPHLQSASIQGYNALRRVGHSVGIVLSALGLQLDSALPLLDQPDAWQRRLQDAAADDPSVRHAVAFILGPYAALSPSGRLELSAMYRSKVEPLVLDPRLHAMFCVGPPTIDFEEVARHRQTVIVDFRHETNAHVRLLKTRWVFDSLMAYIRHRTPGAHVPFGILIDELTELTRHSSLEHDIFAADLDYLMNVLARNRSVAIVAAHQEMWQLSPQTQQTVLSMGTQIFGVMSDLTSAEVVARAYAALDPERVKRWRKVWMSSSDRETGATFPFVVDQEPVEYTLDEQAFLAGRAFMALKPFQFVIKPHGENRLVRVSLAEDVGALWPNQHADLLSYIRQRLAERVVYERPAPHLIGQPPSARLIPHEQDTSDRISATGDELDPSYWRT